MAKKDDKKLLETARDRFKRCVEADQENRRKAVEDLKFLHVPGEQWDAALKSERGNRPNYEFNKLRVTIKRIVNDIRANRPQAKVRAVEDGDKDTASVLEGLCRNVWTVSDADAAVDIAAEYSVGGGMGAWRVITDYADDSAWDQDLRIVPIRNPLSLWCDPSAKDPMKRDARYWFFESRMDKEVYKAKYGKVPAVDWDSSEFADLEDWEDDDSVRICEYWYQKPVKKTLALLDDGSTVDVEATDPQMLFAMDEFGQSVSRITRVREVQSQQICMAIIGGGDKVIEPSTEWAGSKFPFVQVYGEYVVIDGKVHWFGLTRFAKDAQRAYNFERTLFLETEAKAPLDTDWATVTQAQGMTEQWARAHKELLPFRLYNPDPLAGGPPIRSPGAQVPPALALGLQISAEDIKSVTGIFDNSLGQKANEASGVAIRARQAQGEIATFNYADNIARAVRYTHELLVDLIPKIYDAERSIRILGADGAEQYAKVNEVGPDGQVKNDLSRGKYDVSVTVGPNMGTQRQEAAEVYMGLMQGNPGLFPIVGDLVMKTFDNYPYSDEMAERLRLMAPPQIQQMLAQKEQNGGKAMDPQAQAAMAQAEQIMMQVQEMSQVVQQAAQEAEGLKAEAEKEMVELNSAKATLEAEFQKMLADLAKREAQLILKDASMTAKQVERQAEGGVDDEGNLNSAVVNGLKQQADEFMAQAAQVLAQIQEAGGRGNRKIQMRKVNGGYEAQEGNRKIKMRKVNGGYEADIEE
jgi:hypothetical protein